MYYNNTFFHIGHLGAMLENERRARERKVLCYVYVDDRTEEASVSDVKQYVRYLKLTQHRVVSVCAHHAVLLAELSRMAAAGTVVLHCNATNDHVNSKYDGTLVQHVLANAERYTYCVFVSGKYAGRMDVGHGIQLSYAYVVSTLDRVLGVDAQAAEKSNAAYTIRSFCYTKRNWELRSAAHMHLLTLRGLELRHFPMKALKEFNAEGVASGEVQVARLRALALKHLRTHAVPLRVVVRAAELTLTDIGSNETQYACTADKKYVALGRRVYVDGTVLGLERGDAAVTVGTTFTLSGAHEHRAYRCTALGLRGENRVALSASPSASHATVKIRNWVAYDFSTRAVFHMNNWFYTGYNRFCETEVCEGMVDQSAFTKLNKYVYLVDYGYFAYDDAATKTSGTLTYVQVLGYQEACEGNDVAP